LIILGLGFLRARLLRLCAPLLSLESFYNYARGHCAAARNFFSLSFFKAADPTSSELCALFI